MLDNVTPGSRIHVKVVKTPRNAAAAKTLVRLLHRDAKVAEEQRRLKRVLHSNFRTKRRSGRNWPVHMVKQHPVKGQAGESGTILASVDALPDLHSVNRFIEITKA